MATRVTVRPPSGPTHDIAFDGTEFVDPATADIDVDLNTGNLWALPGLADAHAHLTMTSTQDVFGITDDAMLANIPRNAWAHVERGVLLILDKGGKNDLSLVSLDHDADLRPYVETAGAIIHPALGYAEGFGAEVEPEDLVAHIRTRAATTGGWIKIVGDWPRRGVGPVSNYSLDTLTEAVGAAHAAGAKVAVHTMADSASEAVAAGVDSIEHGPFLNEADLKALAARKGAWVPTIVNLLDLVDTLGPDSSGGKLFLEGLDQMRTTIPLAEELGVSVMAGTDMAVPHGEVSVEALRLREYGMSNRGATDAASLNAYRYIGKPGTIREGDVASAVFFGDNPYEDVSTLGSPLLVIHRGRVVVDRR